MVPPEPTTGALPKPVLPPLLCYSRTPAPGEVRVEGDAEGVLIVVGPPSVWEVLVANAHLQTALLIAYSPAIYLALWLCHSWLLTGMRPDSCGLLFVLTVIGFFVATYSSFVTVTWARRVMILRVHSGRLAIDLLPKI